MTVIYYDLYLLSFSRIIIATREDLRSEGLWVQFPGFCSDLLWGGKRVCHIWKIGRSQDFFDR